MTMPSKKESTADKKPHKSVLNSLKVWVFPLVSMGVATLLAIFLVWPWFQDIQLKREELAAGRNEVTLLMTKLDTLNAQDPDQLKDYLVRLNFAVPSQSSPPLVLATVEQALSTAGMAVQSVQYDGIRQIEDIQNTGTTVSTSDDLQQPSATSTTPEEEIPKGGYVEVQLAAQGDYSQVVNFLKTVHKVNPLVLGINFHLSLNTTTGPGNQATADKSYTFEGSAPFQSIPDNLGAITNQITGLNRDEQKLIQGLEGLTTFFSPEEAEQTDQFETGKDNPF